MVSRLLVAVPFLLLLGAAPATAQDSTGQRPPRDSAIRNQYGTWPDRNQSRGVLIGPTFGLNFARFGGEDVSGVDTRIGFQAGVFASFPIGRIAAIRPSVLYSQQGTQVDAAGGVTVTFKMNYIEVPVLLRLSAPLQESGRLRLYVEAGPSVAFEASCRLEGSNGSQSTELECDDDQLGLESKSVLFNAHFGAGVEISRFSLGARYQLGLTSVDDTGGGSDIKHRVIALVAGYGFRLGH